MYEPSRVLLSFHIAGFQYADGALVLGDLKAGDKLTLCAERDNPHDPEAVAIYSTMARPNLATFRETRSARCP